MFKLDIEYKNRFQKTNENEVLSKKWTSRFVDQNYGKYLMFSFSVFECNDDGNDAISYKRPTTRNSLFRISSEI